MDTSDAQPEGYAELWAELPTLLFIPLTRGKFTVIEGVDWPLVAGRKWNARPDTKANTCYVYAGDNIPMHSVLMGGKRADNREVDHRNLDGLDNRRSNLRLATRSQNAANRPGWARSGVKGAYQVGDAFVSRIGKRNLGAYRTAEAAGAAYDLAAIPAWGEFARLNFPDWGPEQLKQLVAESRPVSRWEQKRQAFLAKHVPNTKAD